MRISCDPQDPGFANDCNCRIFLDGLELRNVITADEEQGYVLIDVTDEAGNFVVDGDEIRREELRGRVEVKR